MHSKIENLLEKEEKIKDLEEIRGGYLDVEDYEEILNAKMRRTNL